MKKSFLFLLLLLSCSYFNDPFLPPEDFIPIKKNQMKEVLLLIDRTGDCQLARAQLKKEFNLELTNCKTGIAAFSDFPFSPYGGTIDKLFDLICPLTSNPDCLCRAINCIEDQDGNDIAEGQIEALFQSATGEGYLPYTPPSNPGWTKKSKKIIILITSSPFHKEASYPGHKYSDTMKILNSKKIIVNIIIIGNRPDTKSDMELISKDTKGKIFEISNAGTGINEVIRSVISSED